MFGGSKYGAKAAAKVSTEGERKLGAKGTEQQSGPRRTAESTWRRGGGLAERNVEGSRGYTSNTTRRFGEKDSRYHEDDRIPEWMSDDAPLSPPIQNQDNARAELPSLLSAVDGMDQVAAYREAMKEREQQLGLTTGQLDPGLWSIPVTQVVHLCFLSLYTEKTPFETKGAMFDNLTTANKSGSIAAEQRSIAASFLLPQAKSKTTATPDIDHNPVATMASKGSRFARFFDPTAAAPIASANADPVPPSQRLLEQMSQPAPTEVHTQSDPYDKTQGLAALLGIKPASLNMAREGASPSPVISHQSRQPISHPPAAAAALPGSPFTRPPLSGHTPNTSYSQAAPAPPISRPDSRNQSVDHMTRLLGMLKTAQTSQGSSAPLSSQGPSLGNSIPDARTPISSAASPSSGSRLLAAMLSGDKTKQASVTPPMPYQNSPDTRHSSVAGSQGQSYGAEPKDMARPPSGFQSQSVSSPVLSAAQAQVEQHLLHRPPSQQQQQQHQQQQQQQQQQHRPMQPSRQYLSLIHI